MYADAWYLDCERHVPTPARAAHQPTHPATHAPSAHPRAAIPRARMFNAEFVISKQNARVLASVVGIFDDAGARRSAYGTA